MKLTVQNDFDLAVIITLFLLCALGTTFPMRLPGKNSVTMEQLATCFSYSTSVHMQSQCVSSSRLQSFHNVHTNITRLLWYWRKVWPWWFSGRPADSLLWFLRRFMDICCGWTSEMMMLSGSVRHTEWHQHVFRVCVCIHKWPFVPLRCVSLLEAIRLHIVNKSVTVSLQLKVFKSYFGVWQEAGSHQQEGCERKSPSISREPITILKVLWNNVKQQLPVYHFT